MQVGQIQPQTPHKKNKEKKWLEKSRCTCYTSLLSHILLLNIDWWNNIELYLPWRKSRKTSIKANVGAHYHQNKPKWREQEAYLYPHKKQSRSVKNKKSIHKTQFPWFHVHTQKPNGHRSWIAPQRVRLCSPCSCSLHLSQFLDGWQSRQGQKNVCKCKALNYYFFLNLQKSLLKSVIEFVMSWAGTRCLIRPCTLQNLTTKMQKFSIVFREATRTLWNWCRCSLCFCYWEVLNILASQLALVCSILSPAISISKATPPATPRTAFPSGLPYFFLHFQSYPFPNFYSFNHF